MKLLKLLTEVTDKKNGIFAYFKSCRELCIDSLTYIEYISRIEEFYAIDFPDEMLTELYLLKLFILNRKIRLLKYRYEKATK